MEEYIMGVMEALEEGILSLNFTTSGLGVIVYVLQALALYTIAKRRGIKKPWMAWIPLVNVWILGSISDQYQYVVKRQVKNKRKVLLGLNIAMAALIVLLIVAIIWLIVALIMTGVSLELFSDGNMPGSNLDAVALDALADAAFRANETKEDIGARRLHTLFEQMLEDISFNAGGDMPDVDVQINGDYVSEHLGGDGKAMDIRRYML